MTDAAPVLDCIPCQDGRTAHLNRNGSQKNSPLYGRPSPPGLSPSVNPVHGSNREWPRPQPQTDDADRKRGLTPFRRATTMAASTGGGRRSSTTSHCRLRPSCPIPYRRVASHRDIAPATPECSK